MNILIVYGEERVKFDPDGNKFTTGAYSKEIWKNCYNMLSSNITFMSRRDKNSYTNSECEKMFNKIPNNVKFNELFDINESYKTFISLKSRKLIKDNIREAVKMSDFIIIRVPSIYGYYAIKYSKFYKKKYVVEVVGSAFESLWYHSKSGKMLSIPYDYLQKKYVFKSKNVVYVTQNYLQKKYRNVNSNIGCSDVCLQNFNNDVIKRRIDKIFSTNDKIVLGTCGAINVPYKGHRFVLKAISILINLGYDIRYDIVGGGDPEYLLKMIRKFKVENNVNIKGPIEHIKVFEWLESEVDIYIQPSETEGLSRALLEATSVGCPAIASDVGGNAEIINKKYIFPKGKYKNLAQLIIKIIYEKNTMIEMALENYRSADKFNKEYLFNKRLKFYKECINGGKNE